MKIRFWDPARVFLLISTSNAFSVGLTLGTYVLFLKDLGLTPLEINLVNGFFYLGRFFLEVPTGAIADLFGRRASSLVSFVLYAAGLLLYWQATTFLGCVLAELVLAFGATCLSGAFEAWVADELRARAASPGDLHRLFAREAMLDRLAFIVAAPIGGVAAMRFGLASTWLFAALVMGALAVLAALLMRETRVAQPVRHAHRAIAETAVRSISYAFRPGPVRVFLAVSACFAFASMAPNMQWAPYFEEAVGGPQGTGMLFSGISVVLLAGSWAAPRLLRALRDEWRALGAVLILGGIGTALVGILGMPLSLGAFALYELAAGAFAPLKKASLNNAITSDDRATVLSCEEMAAKLGGACGLLVTGIAAEHAGIGAAWVLGGIVFVAGGALAFRAHRKRRRW